MFDYEKMDMPQWREVLLMRQKALFTYICAAVKYEDLPAAKELVEQYLEKHLSPDEIDVLQNALIPPELTISHSWQDSNEQQPEETEYERMGENELLDREDASNAGLVLNNVIDMNNAMLKLWLMTMAKNIGPRETKTALGIVSSLSDNSFLLSFVMDAIARGYKNMALALVGLVRSNTLVMFSTIRRNFDVLLIMPQDFPEFEKDFVSTLDMLLQSLEKLDSTEHL